MTLTHISDIKNIFFVLRKREQALNDCHQQLDDYGRKFAVIIHQQVSLA